MKPGYRVCCASRRLLALIAVGFRMLFVALPLGLALALLFPLPASAHAVLLRSDPASQAILKVAPTQVRLWFSEDLNSAFSTLSVINGANQRVDNQDVQLAPNDARELEVTLKPNLPPAVYIVVWQSDSANDGHVESSSFVFTLARPDGSLPPMSANATAAQSAPNQQGQWDGPTVFALLAITLLELSAVFWVGAYCWMLFVLPPTGATAADQADQAEEQTVSQGVRRRFERRLLPFTLLIVILANSGALIGQALALTQGNVAKALDPSLLWNLATTSTAGLFWFAREIIALLALRLALYSVQLRRRSPRVNETLQWISLLLGLAFMLALAMSSHAAATPPHILLAALVAEWLHLLAAALWIGGMLFIATGYLSVLRQRSEVEQARSLVSVLPSYSPWAVAGVILMAVTGPFIAVTRLSAGSQLLTTRYGQVLDIKTALVALLLLTSAAHVFVLQPRLRKAYQRYAFATRQPASAEERVPVAIPLITGGDASASLQQSAQQAAEEVKQAEARVGRHTRALTRTLRCEAALGIVVLVCVGLLNVFAGTLAPASASAGQQPVSPAIPQPFHARLITFDRQFTVTLSIAPNRAGSNHFTVEVFNTRTGAVTTDVKVSLNTEMLDMDMGIGVIDLKADGHGRFSADGDFAMSGNWQIIVQIVTLNDPYHFHEAYVKLFTPA